MIVSPPLVRALTWEAVMRSLHSGLAGLASLLLFSCSTAPTQTVQTAAAGGGQCEDFARSGGYPFLSGGRMGGNPNVLQLPGAQPLIFGPMDSDLDRHLEEQDYLRNWCLNNLDKF